MVMIMIVTAVVVGHDCDKQRRGTCNSARTVHRTSVSSFLLILKMFLFLCPWLQ